MQDLRESAEAGADGTTTILNLTLRTLPRQQQAMLPQLAVFPSGFTEAGAAAVLGWDDQRVHGLLTVFYRHGLVMR